MDDPVFNPQRMKLKFETDGISGDNVLKVEGIEKTFGDKKVLSTAVAALEKVRKTWSMAEMHWCMRTERCLPRANASR